MGCVEGMYGVLGYVWVMYGCWGMYGVLGYV